jgi:8-oxo-dGTP pyrophosphatase MutT (NUDIX family)
MLEPGMGPAESAAKEAFEEAGVRGRVSDSSVGNYAYRKWGGTIEVEVFLLEVQEELNDWPEAQARHREWLTVEQAVHRVAASDLGAILEKVAQLI